MLSKVVGVGADGLSFFYGPCVKANRFDYIPNKTVKTLYNFETKVVDKTRKNVLP